MAKYYLIYLINKKMADIFCKNDDNLYAYTTDKDMLKRFKSQRKMNLFKIIKKDLSRSECNMLAKIFKNQLLTDADLTTSTTKNGMIENAIVTISMTMEEKNLLIATSEYTKETKLLSYAKIDPKLLKDQYYNALDLLNYTDIYSLVYEGKFLSINADEKSSLYDPYVRRMLYDYDDSKYIVRNYIQLDMLMLFLESYANLMSI